MRLRIVVDTSVLISAALIPDSLPGRAVREVVLSHVSLISYETYAEAESRLLQSKFDAYASLEERLRFLEMLFFAAERISVSTILSVCRDPKDNKFLELAVDGQADCIITSDADLLVLHPFRGIEIVTPKAFLDRSKP